MMSFGPGFPNTRNFELPTLAQIFGYVIPWVIWGLKERQKVSQILEFKGEKIGVLAMGIATTIVISYAFFHGSMQVLEFVVVSALVTVGGGVIILFSSWGLIYRSMRRYSQNQADIFAAF